MIRFDHHNQQQNRSYLNSLFNKKKTKNNTKNKM